MSTTTATATTSTSEAARPFSRTQMVRELVAYGHRTGERRVPRGEWEDREWDHLAEVAMGAH
jgi:hypothetical protein